MIETKKIKFLIIILIVVAVCILPAAFSVSYARWQGGAPSLSATVNVSGGTSGNPTNPDDNRPFTEFPDDFLGGIVAIDSNGNQIPVDYDTEDGTGDGYIESSSELYVSIQIYSQVLVSQIDGQPNPAEIPEGAVQMHTTVNGQSVPLMHEDGDKYIYVRPINYTLYCYSGEAQHQDGSYWYTIPTKRNFSIFITIQSEYQEGQVIITFS